MSSAATHVFDITDIVSLHFPVAPPVAPPRPAPGYLHPPSSATAPALPEVVSLRSGATVSPPTPALDGVQSESAPRRFNIAARSRSFLPSPSPIRQAAPKREGAFPPPPCAVAPRFRPRRVARQTAHAQRRRGRSAPQPALRASSINLFASSPIPRA